MAHTTQATSKDLPLALGVLARLMPFALPVLLGLWLLAGALPIPVLPEQALPVERLQRLFVFSLGLNLVALVVGVAWTAREIALPLRRWGRELEHLRRKRDLHERLTLTGPRELAELAGNLNAFLDELQDSMVDRASVDRILRLVSDSLIFVSTDGRIEAVNPAACEALGYVDDELLGEQISRLLRCDEEEDETASGEIAIDDLHLHGRLDRVEAELVARDGHHIPVRLSGTLLNEPDGTSRGMVLAVTRIPSSPAAEPVLAPRVAA